LAHSLYSFHLLIQLSFSLSLCHDFQLSRSLLCTASLHLIFAYDHTRRNTSDPIPNSAIKPSWARLVLRWGTTGESRGVVGNFFCPSLMHSHTHTHQLMLYASLLSRCRFAAAASPLLYTYQALIGTLIVQSASMDTHISTRSSPCDNLLIDPSTASDKVLIGPTAASDH
jgi:hypothetical protein